MKTTSTQPPHSVGCRALVRPSIDPEWCQMIMNGVKPPISEDVKDMVMGWLVSENTEKSAQDQHIEQDSQQQKQAPIHPVHVGSECSCPVAVIPPLPQNLLLTLAGFCIRISYCGCGDSVDSKPN